MATFASASGGTNGSWSISETISGAGDSGATVKLSSGSAIIAATTASGAGAYAGVVATDALISLSMGR